MLCRLPGDRHQQMGLAQVDSVGNGAHEGHEIDAAAGERYFTLGYDFNMQDFALLFGHSDRGVLPLSLLSEMRICLLSSSDSSIADVLGAVMLENPCFSKAVSTENVAFWAIFKRVSNG